MKAVVLDTETTGLIHNRSIALDRLPEVIEFFSCNVDLATGKIGKKYETLIKPRNFPMSEKTIRETRTQLSNDILQDAFPFEKAAPAIKKIIEDAPVVIAHNVAFDKEMLDVEFERIGQKLKWPRVICTIEQTLHIKGYRLNLTNLHVELFGKKFDSAHRAKADVLALTKCCVELYKRKLL
jgi:DNA polymerase III alpha subunit (gram-positive type)